MRSSGGVFLLALVLVLVIFLAGQERRRRDISVNVSPTVQPAPVIPVVRPWYWRLWPWYRPVVPVPVVPVRPVIRPVVPVPAPCPGPICPPHRPH